MLQTPLSRYLLRWRKEDITVRGYEGTKVRRYEGTKVRRYEGTRVPGRKMNAVGFTAFFCYLLFIIVSTILNLSTAFTE